MPSTARRRRTAAGEETAEVAEILLGDETVTTSAAALAAIPASEPSMAPEPPHMAEMAVSGSKSGATAHQAALAATVAGAPRHRRAAMRAARELLPFEQAPAHYRDNPHILGWCV